MCCATRRRCSLCHVVCCTFAAVWFVFWPPAVQCLSTHLTRFTHVPLSRTAISARRTLAVDGRNGVYIVSHAMWCGVYVCVCVCRVTPTLSVADAVVFDALYADGLKR